jgi:hypothetical protein
MAGFEKKAPGRNLKNIAEKLCYVISAALGERMKRQGH